MQNGTLRAEIDLLRLELEHKYKTDEFTVLKKELQRTKEEKAKLRTENDALNRLKSKNS